MSFGTWGSGFGCLLHGSIWLNHLLIWTQILNSNSCFNFQLSSHFYKIDCIKENETKYLQNINCEVNKVGKGLYAVTVLADLVLTANHVNVSIDIYQRPSNLNVFNMTLEYCSSYENLSPIVQLFIEGLRNFANNLFHACPFMPRKRMGVQNMPMAIGLPLISLINIPRGDYRTVISIRDQKKEFIFNVQLLGTVSQKRGQKNG